MKQLGIESLFDGSYPHASFHDARIRSLNLDYVKREATFRCVLYVGNPDVVEDRESTAAGVLIMTGLLYCVIEAPDPDSSYEDAKGLDVASDGPVPMAELNESLPNLPRDLPENAFVHRFFITNCNSQLFIAATGAHFQWSGESKSRKGLRPYGLAAGEFRVPDDFDEPLPAGLAFG